MCSLLKIIEITLIATERFTDGTTNVEKICLQKLNLYMIDVLNLGLGHFLVYILV